MTAALKGRPKAKTARKEFTPAPAAEVDWSAMLTEALEAPGALGRTYTRFYDYSFLNQIRLMMQGVLEPVATYRRWAELGYQVQKGSKAKLVLAPIMVSRTRTDANGNPILKDGKPQKRQIIVGFRDSRTVFGFSDTDGEELPPLEMEEFDVEAALAALGVTREKFAHADGNTQGYSYENDEAGKVIAINPTAVYPTKTLMHELAHLVLGHCKGLADGTPVCSRHIGEVQAEAVAYLVAKELELLDWNPAESRGYIQHWLGSDEVSEKAISAIFSATNKILVAGRKAVAQAA